MPTRIRLQRKGKKGRPYYHLVVADSRAPRDGKFIEKIGTYNPLTKPADIDLDFERALYWLQTGAQPTDTVRAILSYKGILYKNHLQNGVKKGALTQEQADAKFDGWLKDKEAKIAGAVQKVEQASTDEQKKRLEAERKVNEDRAKELQAKRAAELKEMEKEKAGAEEEATEEAEEAAPAEETTDETPATEEVAEETEAKEEPVAEVKEEEPAKETPAEEEAEEVKEEQEATPEEEKPAEAEQAEETEEKTEEEPAADEDEEKKAE